MVWKAAGRRENREGQFPVLLPLFVDDTIKRYHYNYHQCVKTHILTIVESVKGYLFVYYKFLQSHNFLKKQEM